MKKRRMKRIIRILTPPPPKRTNTSKTKPKPATSKENNLSAK